VNASEVEEATASNVYNISHEALCSEIEDQDFRLLGSKRII
jgi:hypothetical protein